MINLKKMKINKLLPIQVVKVWSVVQEVRHDVGTFKVVGGGSKILDDIWFYRKINTLSFTLLKG